MYVWRDVCMYVVMLVCMYLCMQEHYATARATQKLLQDYKGLQDIIAILGQVALRHLGGFTFRNNCTCMYVCIVGMDELSEDDKLTVARAR